MSYIVPRQKPKECWYCPFMSKITYDCRIIRNKYPDLDSQYADCPLIEVPPHGRLNKLKAQYVHGKGNDEIESAWISNIRRAITKAPTVIEAEE